MRYTSSSWFPLKNFCSQCDYDWQVGVSQWKGVKDFLTGRPIKMFETVFWNRRLGNISVSLNDYNKFKNDTSYNSKMKTIGLPIDIKL